MPQTGFDLQFDPARIKELAAGYSYRLDDEEAFMAGARIAKREFGRANLEVIRTIAKIVVVDEWQGSS